MVAQHYDFQCEPWSLLTGLKGCSAPSQLCHVGHTQSLSPELIICVPRETGVNNPSASVVVLGAILCVSCQLLVTTGWWWAVSITAKGITFISVLNPHSLWCVTLIRTHVNWLKNHCMSAGGGSKFPAARRPTRESHSLSETETLLSYFSTSLRTFKPRPCALLGIMREAGQLLTALEMCFLSGTGLVSPLGTPVTTYFLPYPLLFAASLFFSRSSVRKLHNLEVK